MRCCVLILLVAVAAAAPTPTTYESENAARLAAEAELAKLGEAEDSSPALTAAAENAAIAMAKQAEADPMHDGMTGMKVDLGEMEDPSEKKGEVEQPAIAVSPDAVEPVDTANEQSVTQTAAEEVPVVKHMKLDDEQAAKKKELADAKKKEAARVRKEREDTAEGHLIADGDAQALDGSVFGAKGSRPSAPQFGMGMGMPFGQMLGNQGAALQTPELGSQQPSNPMNMFGMPQVPQNMFNQPLPQSGAMGMDQQAIPAMMQQMQQAMGMGQGLGMPNMMGMPQMGMGMGMPPQMGMPDMSQMGMPQMGMPQMPQMGMPQMPQMGMPQMPQMGMPQMPGMPQMGMPDMSQMGLMGMPQMSQMGFMPQMPQQ